MVQARARRAERVEISVEANARYFAEMMRNRHTQVFWQDSCAGANSYYFDKFGDVGLRRSTTWGSARASRTFDIDDYRFGGTPAGARR